MEFTSNLLTRMKDFFDQLPGMFNLALYNNLENFYNYGSNILLNISNKIVNATFNLPSIFLILLFTVISAFFLSKDKEMLTDYLVSRIKFTDSDYANVLKDIFTYIKVQLLIVTNTTILTAITFSLLKYPYAIILALLAGILDLIPVLGPGAIYIPVAVINLFFNFKHSIILLIVYILIIGVRPVLESKIVGKRIGVHPLVSIAGCLSWPEVIWVSGCHHWPRLQSLSLKPCWMPESAIKKHREHRGTVLLCIIQKLLRKSKMKVKHGRTVPLCHVLVVDAKD